MVSCSREWSGFAYSSSRCFPCGVTAPAAGLSYLLLAANKTNTGRVSSNTAALASDKTRALLAVQTPVPRLLSNVIDQSTKVLQHACFSKAAAQKVCTLKLAIGDTYTYGHTDSHPDPTNRVCQATVQSRSHFSSECECTRRSLMFTTEKQAQLCWPHNSQGHAERHETLDH